MSTSNKEQNSTNTENEASKTQDKAGNVQRLEGDASSQIILPRVLGELVKHNDALSPLKKELLEIENLNGNDKRLNEYKKLLPPLDDVQWQWSIGLLLGDASLQANSNLKAYRIKIQQADFNEELLYATQEILNPYVLSGVSESKVREIGNTYRELQTLSCPQMEPLAKLFEDPKTPTKANGVVKKVIPADIGKHLGPVAVAAWFCGDGGRRDYGKNEGKAIQFHTQGFTEECCKRLAAGLSDRYGWDILVKNDYDKHFFIQVEASSFDSVCETFKPYVLNNFQKRFPKPRVK